MATATRSGIVRMQVGGNGCGQERRGDHVIVSLDEAVAMREWCPDHLVDLLDPPADRDDAVAALRWSLAWRLECCRVETIARASRVSAAQIMRFLEAPDRQAGQVLTFAEAARLIRYLGERIEDRELAGEYRDMRAIAEPYLEVAGLDYRAAVRRARAARSAHRAANAKAGRLA